MKRPLTTALVSMGIIALFATSRWTFAGDGNRLTYLDGSDPYYVSRTFPKLITPQWVGESGVDAVVIVAIDDMRDPARYETFLRPAIDRLKKIDGRAPISIMTCKVDPADPRLQKFLAEGMSLEVHTIDHPCPILAGGDFAKARKNYDDCIDLMDGIAGMHAVAFRTPCCDSKNTLSPRFLAEIFNGITSQGNFLQADSSVCNRFTADDPALPRELVLDENSADRYARYVPFPSFVNSIRDYPYPYVIGKLCWEFPCVTPSDWQSHNIQGDGNPQLIKDWEAQLDATVIKQGTFTLVFHPYGWSKPEQIAELVDHIDQKYGKRVKFLTFAEAVERINKNVLGGHPLRGVNGQDNGVRLLDLNNDGYLDVVIGNPRAHLTRLWDPATSKWIVSGFPSQIVFGDSSRRSFDGGVRFGILRSDGAASMLASNENTQGAWSFTAGHWVEDAQLRAALDLDGGIFATRDGVDQGVRLRDVDNRGRCELLVSNPKQQAAYAWDAAKHAWTKLPFAIPQGLTIVDAEGRDAGLRFVDVDEDGVDDVLFSDDQRFGLYLWNSMADGWSHPANVGRRTPGDRSQIPPIVVRGTNNGAWFMKRTMWVQNEQTDTLPDVVDRKSFAELLGKTEPGPKNTAAALKSITLRPGFAVQLAAAEPLTRDPIAFAWGPDRRLWVVEMGDYPLGIDGKGTPGGVIRVLEDTNGDGVYVKSTVFLDHLAFPTGIMPWGKGVLVTDPPNIFYAEDTKGDGHCDYRKIIYSGFGEGNQQHRANGLLWGLDNWIHGANGNSGGNVTTFKGGKALNISGRDFRIRPDDGLIEAETGQTQYGHTMSDWGDWFGCDNTNPMYQ
ncbi:MAG TPA: PVC-type heme-binding CxxCH protein, partial [Humisphaera sp.]|nr:PVC-type heme-binding CxxCH protein [Humisphaera sp.]